MKRVRDWISHLRFTGVGEKKTRQLAGATIGCQAFVFLFAALVSWGLANSTGDPHKSWYLWGGLALAVLALYSSASMRKPIGIPLGWALQIATFLCAILLPSMLIVGVIFLALWLTAIIQGDKMDQLTRDFIAQHNNLGETE